MNITVNQTISADLKYIRFPVLFFDWEGAGRGGVRDNENRVIFLLNALEKKFRGRHVLAYHKEIVTSFLSKIKWTKTLQRLYLQWNYL